MFFFVVVEEDILGLKLLIILCFINKMPLLLF